uniref:UDENN domain-containing protein n=1 Tax=Meloidogyne javanica TaxID=6303 RepID=A0A915LUD8_MELJA
QKIPTKVLTDLTTKEKIDVFKHFNFNKLIAFQKISRYFNNFINENKKELARDYLNIKIVDKLVMPKGPYFKYKELNIKVKSYDFVLNDDLKKKWELAVSERIPLFLGFNESCEAVIILRKIRPTKEDAKFENEARKFVKDHLKIFNKFSVDFTACKKAEQCNGAIMDMLNDRARFHWICILTCLKPSIFELIKNKITTSTNCSSIVKNIEFKVGNWDLVWNFNYLHNREGVETKQFIQYGQAMYTSGYEIANIDNPNIVFIDIATIFDVCCVVSSDASNSVQIKVLYPQEFNDEGILKSIKQFCIPHNALNNASVENEPVQLFTFAFTDASSLHTFGYCRFTPRNNSVLCILSGFLWTSFFYKFLNHISTVTTKGAVCLFYFSQLSSCVFGLAKLLNPFEWQNLFIPILPQDLTDMAPMPYLIGVPKQIFLKINKNELGDIVLTDLDEKMLSSPYQDKLPQEAYNYLWSRLKLSNDLFLSDSFAKTFLRTNAILFGNYNCGFTQGPDGIYTWDREIFLERERPSIRPYLETLIGKDGVQYFERFVQERLEALKDGIAINDKFEKEVQSLDVRGLSKGIWSRPPELLQQTVSSIKENASDVIFALKDQFQSMKAYALEFDLNKEMTLKLNGGRGEEGEGKKAVDVETLLSSNHFHSSLHSNIHSSPNLYIQATTTTPNSNSPNNSSSFSSNSQSLIIPNGNTLAYTRSLQSEQFKRKNNWETFD